MRAGLYQADAWHEVIGTDVPAGLTADDYAAGLAAQVRLAHPTLVAADRLRKGQSALAPERGDVIGAAASFLESGAAANRIGARPLNMWDGFAALPPDVQDGLKRFERVYQISPSDQSMSVLLSKGLDSALSVSRFTESEFLEAHGGDFPNVREAQLVHRKAQQVHGTALTLATDYLRMRAGPHLNSSTVRNSPDRSCRKARRRRRRSRRCSATSTSARGMQLGARRRAYLVDLLEMLDLTGWRTISTTRRRCCSTAGPICSTSCCRENTNTAMAYIDIVNEVLEYTSSTAR